MKRSADHSSDRPAPAKCAQVARFIIEGEDLEGYTADKHSAHFKQSRICPFNLLKRIYESVLG